MTSRERIIAAFYHQEPDRTPCFEYVLLSPVADAVLGRHYEDFGGDMKAWFDYAEQLGGYEKAIQQYAVDRVELAQKLGHDMIYCVPNPPENIFKKKPDDNPLTFNDPVEAIKWSNASSKERLKEPLYDFIVYPLLREQMKKRDMDLPIYAPAFSHGIWTNTDLMQTLLLEPEIAHEHFLLCTEFTLRYIDIYTELGVEIIGVGGDFAGNRPLISPEMYRDFIMPELKKLTEIIRVKGKFSVNASDGNLWDVTDYFLLGSGVDGYGEIDAGAGMDLKKLKKQYGDRITFLGNIDCGNLLTFGTEEEIRATVRRCLEDGMGNGGHIFTASNAITGSVSLQNYLYMVNEYRRFFGLSIICF
ncbi:MAG: uroporphyrinogen decarboxylase family protein [Treponema sp.]|jgi:uroporphyrinogen decarboxylase|nr:uroporphyrinogen decarboxylase family protein [Treponema sp.]